MTTESTVEAPVKAARKTNKKIAAATTTEAAEHVPTVSEGRMVTSGGFTFHLKG